MTRGSTIKPAASPTTPVNNDSFNNGEGGSGKKNAPFRRVQSENVVIEQEGLRDNSFKNFEKWQNLSQIQMGIMILWTFLRQRSPKATRMDLPSALMFSQEQLSI